MTPTLMLWLLSAVTLLASISALVASNRTSARSLLKRLSALSERLEDAEMLIADLARQLKNERSRQTMRDLRHRKRTERDEPEESSNGQSAAGTRPMTEAEKDEWTRAMNYKIATGQVRLR